MRLSHELRDRNLLSESGEMLWGAMINALDAISHRRYGRHLGNNAERRRLLADMIRLGRIESADIDAFAGAVRVLHDDFYHPNRDDRMMLTHIASARDLVMLLLEI